MDLCLQTVSMLVLIADKETGRCCGAAIRHFSVRAIHSVFKLKAESRACACLLGMLLVIWSQETPSPSGSICLFLLSAHLHPFFIPTFPTVTAGSTFSSLCTLYLILKCTFLLCGWCYVLNCLSVLVFLTFCLLHTLLF